MCPQQRKMGVHFLPLDSSILVCVLQPLLTASCYVSMPPRFALSLPPISPSPRVYFVLYVPQLFVGSVLISSLSSYPHKGTPN